MTPKPMGAIPPEFRDGQALDALVGGGITPLFMYDMDVVSARVVRFRAAFPGIDLHYAIKANPHPTLLGRIAPLVDGLDVASTGELLAALVVMAGERISFAGPGKDDREIAVAAERRVTINAESIAEIDRALRLPVPPPLAVRINPAFELRGSGMRMGGRPSPFGIDDHDAAAAVRKIVAAGAEWRGLHVYAGSQSLDTGAIIEAQRETVALAARLAEAIGQTPPLVNLGGGFGVPYFAGDKPLDVEAIGAALGETLANRPPILRESRFAIELGRWLVAEAGVYLTRVLDRKESHGETFLVVDGGLHHMLATSGNFGTVVRRNYPIAVAHRVGVEPEEVVNVVGRLCTPLDRLGDRIALPRAEVGDLIAIFMAGAYGATASPVNFLGHPPAGETVVG